MMFWTRSEWWWHRLLDWCHGLVSPSHELNRLEQNCVTGIMQTLSIRLRQHLQCVRCVGFTVYNLCTRWHVCACVGHVAYFLPLPCSTGAISTKYYFEGQLCFIILSLMNEFCVYTGCFTTCGHYCRR